MEKTDHFIYGASGHGKVILDILHSSGIQVTAFIDDDVSKKTFSGLPVVRFREIPSGASVIIGIGVNQTRQKLASMINGKFLTAIHPSAVVSSRAEVGEGSVVMQQAVVQAGVTIGKHCIINTSASVDHDCRLGDFVHVSPGATICGLVHIGDLSWIGAGATVIHEINIGKNVMVGAGSVIVQDVPDHAVVVGNPGRIIRYQDAI